MTSAFLIAKRELHAYLRSPLGYVLAAAVLLADGLMFYAFALNDGPHLSAEVLQRFFYVASGSTMVASILVSMRLLSEERQNGTFVLLNTAPIQDTSIVLGKFLSAFATVASFTLLTVYMPLLIFVNGRVSVGHIAVGYLGLLLLASASVAIGLFGSALAKSQVVAAFVSAALMVALTSMWMISRITNPPLSSFLVGLALHNERQRPFMQGLLQFDNCIYYVCITFFFLLAATKVLEARRWR